MATKLIGPRISLYKDTFDQSGGLEVGIDDFLHNILHGTWQDLVLKVRTAKTDVERKNLKKKLPCATISGSFTERNDSGLRAHSGLLAIDLDGLGQETEGIKEMLSKDQYVYAAFVSASGNGLCLLVPIDGHRHADAFEGISHYLYETYRLVVDPSGRNVSRLRYASYDPSLYSSGKPVTFKKYLPKPKPRKENRVVFVQSEFDAIVKEFYDRGINICENYKDWVSVGYAIASKFGSSGEDYFHTLSSLSSKYDNSNTTKLYGAIIKSLSDSKDVKSTIATIYYHAKQHNIPIYSSFTSEVIKSTTTLKKSGLGAESIARNLEQFEGLVVEETLPIIKQALENNVEIEEGDSLVSQVRRWLQYNTSLKRNEVTRFIENNGKPMDSLDFNKLFTDCKDQIEKVDYSLFERLIISRDTVSYNPFLEWFKSYEGRETNGAIDALINTIETPNPEYASRFIKKWLVSIISSIHGVHSPLMLILAGQEQNTGKTEWFRRLLPSELHSQYFAQSKLDRGKDDEILMTQKLIVFDDEMAGKSKKEANIMKNLTSVDFFSLREPYGRANVTLKRLAVLCGTTNELQLLNDPTGNRRFLPVEVISINHAAYNAIDKADLLIEAYNLYKSGFKWQLDKEDIAYLNGNTEKFEIHSAERELILKYFKVPDQDTHSLNIERMSNTDILVYIQSKVGGAVRLGSKTVTQEMNRLGFEQKKSGNIRFFSVVKVDTIAPFN